MMRSRQRHHHHTAGSPNTATGSTGRAPDNDNDNKPSRVRWWKRRLFLALNIIITCIIIIIIVASFFESLSTPQQQAVTTVSKEKKDDNSSATSNICHGYAGVYHIQSGDVGGAAATIFFQFVIAQLMYAEQHNLMPWVFMNNISHHVYDQEVHNHTGAQPTIQFTMLQGLQVAHQQDPRLRRAAFPGKPYLPPNTSSLQPYLFQFTGDGVWQHYFEPVSDFDPTTTASTIPMSSCQSLPLVTMDIWSITPGLHIYAPWTPRMWRYNVLPDYMQQRHLTIREWLTPQRQEAHAMTQRYIRPKPYLWDMANQVLHLQNNTTSTTQHCVGIHVRHSDKGGGRRMIQVDEFLPFIQQFIQHGGNCVMVATDSGKVLHHIQQHWPLNIRNILRYQGNHVLRSNDETPVFELQQPNEQQGNSKLVSHHRTNTEVLVDILALSKCDFLLHGHSAVTDAAMYLNDKLIYQSVNLEDPDDFTVTQFGDMVKDVLVRNQSVNTTKYFPLPWWKQHQDSSSWRNSSNNKNNNNNNALSASSSLNEKDGSYCDGYRGILHIAVGGGEDFSFGMTFFHFILNQLLYADKYNLKPFVHLSGEESQAVYDKRVHGAPRKNDNDPASYMGLVSSAMQTGVIATRNTTLPSTNKEHHYPGDFMASNKSNDTMSTALRLSGNGIWNSYFEPVSSNFYPDQQDDVQSCHGKPLWVTLDKTMVTSGLHLWAPWSVKSFKYSGLPDELWWSENNNDRASQSLSNWYLPMRKQAHDIVSKYYRPHEYIKKRVDQVTGRSQEPGGEVGCCLAVHIRQGDKEGYGKRRVRRIRDYKPFVNAFLNATHNQSFVYLATDAWRVMDAVQENWEESVRFRIRSQGNHVVRSVRWVPAHMLEPDNHHRVNLEALVDVLAMSRCQFLLHGFSTISEAAIYVNINLHNHSVNLDNPDHISVKEFLSLVQGNKMCQGT